MLVKLSCLRREDPLLPGGVAADAVGTGLGREEPVANPHVGCAMFSDGRVRNKRVCKLDGNPPWSCHTHRVDLGYDNWYVNSMAGGSPQNGTPRPNIVWHAARCRALAQCSSLRCRSHARPLCRWSGTTLEMPQQKRSGPKQH